MPATVLPLPDPRHQPVMAEPYYLTFRKQLAASEQIEHVAHAVRTTAKLYDGDMSLDSGPCEPRYRKAAEMAVRYCSQEARNSAERCAEAYAISRHVQLQEDLRSPDATETKRRNLVAGFAYDITRVYLHHLIVGCGRSPEEWRLFEQLEERIDLDGNNVEFD